MTAPGLGMSDEIALTYVGVVPSISKIHSSVETGAREAARLYATAFQAESTKVMSTAGTEVSRVFGTAVKPQMQRAGLEAGKAYGTGLGAGIKASQAEVTASLASMDSAFKAHRQSVQDVTVAETQLATVRRGGAAGETAAAEAALLAARRESTQRLQDLKSAEVVHAKGVEEDGKAAETATGHFGRLGTTLASLKTHFASTGAEVGFTSTLKDMGGAAKEAGGAIKGAAESAVGMATKMASAALSPLGLGAALAGVTAIAIEVTKHLVEIGDTYEGVERIFATQSAAIGEQMEGLEGIVGSVASKSSASIDSIASTVARLSSLTHGLSGGDLNKLTTDISDLQVMLGHPINTEQLVGAAHALGVEDKDLDAFVNRLFNVSRATGVSMDELAEQIRKNGFALKEMNVPADVAVGLLAQMDAQGIPTAGMIRAFGASAKQAGKDHIGFNEELVKQVKHIEDLNRTFGHAAAQDYAAKIFGPRGALSFMAAFDAGILSSNSLTTALDAPKESIQQVFDKTKTLGDQFGILKNTISTALAPLGIAISHSIGGGLQTVSDWLKTHGDSLVQFFSNAAGAALEAAEGILHAFAPIAIMLGKMVVAYGNVFHDEVSKQAGLDMENYGKSITGKDGPIAALEALRHKKDQYFNELKQQVAVGQLFDDSLDPGGDKGLHPKTDAHSQDDLNRLKGYGVEVSGDDNKLTIKTKIKTDLPPEEKAKVDKEIADLVKDGVTAVPGKDGEIALTADSKENKQKIVDFVREQAGKNLQIPVEMVPTMGPLPPGAAPGAPGAPGAAPDDPRHHTTQGRPGPTKDSHGNTRLPSGPGSGGSNDSIPPIWEWPGKAWDALRGHPGAPLPPGATVPGHPELHVAGQTGFTVPGDWHPGKDTVPAMLMPGEEVIRRDQAIRFRPLLKSINAGTVRGYAGGDTVGGNNIFGIPIPNADPNAPAPPPGGWSSKTTQHDQAWQDAQTAAQRGVEHASDRVEDLGDQIEQYRDALATATAALNDPTNTPAETAAAQKEYNKALRELTRATRDLGEAKQDLTTEQRKQVEARDKPADSSNKDGKGGSGEDLGKGLINGLLHGMGFPDVFGASIFDWGVVKTGMAALGDILNLAKTKGWLGPHGATGSGADGIVPGSHGETFHMPGHGESFTMPLPQDLQNAFAQSPVFGGGTGGAPGSGPAPSTGPAPSGSGQPAPGGGGGQGGSGPAWTNFPGSPNARTSGYTVPPGVGGDGSKTQLASAIYSTLTGAGYTPQTAITAIAAGNFESGLDPNSMNPSQHHGIWQESSEKPSAGFGQQISWLLSEMAAQGGPSAFAADPASAFADKVERGGYSGSKYDLGAAAALLGGAASGGFPSGAVPVSVQSTAFTGGGGLGGPGATDTATSGLPRYGAIPGAPSGMGQPIVSWMENQLQEYNTRTGSNLSVSADYPGGPKGHPDDGGDHSARRAIDISGSPEQMSAFANFWVSNPSLLAATRQLIHDDPSRGFSPNKNVIGGGFTSGPGTYSGGVFQEHQNHVHLAMQDIPGDINQLVPPGQPGQPSPYPTAPQQQRPSGQGQSGSGVSLAGFSEDAGLPGDLVPDPLAYPWQTGYHYQHGDPGVFGMAGNFISSLPGGDRIMHPFRGQQNPLGGNVAPAPVAPPPASAVTSSMQTRSAPDLDHVGAGRGTSSVNLVSHYHFDGVTPNAVQQITPKMTSAQISQSRATVPRTV
jgi:hypothetical protein